MRSALPGHLSTELRFVKTTGTGRLRRNRPQGIRRQEALAIKIRCFARTGTPCIELTSAEVAQRRAIWTKTRCST
jgi:hypothetical protein